jgi:hypothetical protein
MDGGRVFRALLVPVLGRLAATEVAATVGTIFAILFAILGVFNPMLFLIAFFGYLAGRQELAAVRYAECRRRLPPLYALPADGEVLDALPVGSLEGVPTPVSNAQPRIWVVRGEGQPHRTYWIE